MQTFESGVFPQPSPTFPLRNKLSYCIQRMNTKRSLKYDSQLSAFAIKKTVTEVGRPSRSTALLTDRQRKSAFE